MIPWQLVVPVCFMSLRGFQLYQDCRKKKEKQQGNKYLCFSSITTINTTEECAGQILKGFEFTLKMNNS